MELQREEDEPKWNLRTFSLEGSTRELQGGTSHDRRRLADDRLPTYDSTTKPPPFACTLSRITFLRNEKAFAVESGHCHAEHLLERRLGVGLVRDREVSILSPSFPLLGPKSNPLGRINGTATSFSSASRSLNSSFSFSGRIKNASLTSTTVVLDALGSLSSAQK